LISFQLTFVYDCTSWVYKYLSAQKQPIRIITNDHYTIFFKYCLLARNPLYLT